MSLEDDTDNAEVELKELVTQTLEENGLLARIRAQLRAGLYLALETDINKRDQQSKNHGSLKSRLAKPDIRTIFCLVHEFLEYFELKFTLNVFERETELGTIYSYENREKLIKDLDIGVDTNAPLLLEILNIARSSFNLSIRNESTNKNDLNNDTYDVPSEKDSYIASNSNSDVSQHVIDIKTVPKDNLIDSKLNRLSHDKIASESSLSHLASNSNSDISQHIDIKIVPNDLKSKLNKSNKIASESSLSQLASNSNSEISQHIDIKIVPNDLKSKLNKSNKTASESSLSHLASNSNSEISQHIDIKTVPNDLKSKLNKPNKSVSESSLSHLASNSNSEHIIDIKTVPKHNLIGSKSQLSASKSNSININPDSDIKTDFNDEINDFNSKLNANLVSEPKFLNLTKITQLDEEQDDTYEGTSSIAEDQSFLIDFDRSIKNTTNLNTIASLTSDLHSYSHAKTLLDQTIVDESTKYNAVLNSHSGISTNLNPKTVIEQTNDDTPKSPRLSFSPDSKKHDKSDRKPMSGLTSLVDLPPLQLNKNRNTLPSLYSKDFREKNALKVEPDNYDDDFLSTSSAENDSPRIKLSPDSDEDKCANSRSRSDKSRSKTARNLEETSVNLVTKENQINRDNNDITSRSTASSISEELDSNIDDILKSTSS